MTLQDLQSTGAEDDRELQDLVEMVRQVCEPDLESFLDAIDGVVNDVQDSDKSSTSLRKEPDPCTNKDSAQYVRGIRNNVTGNVLAHKLDIPNLCIPRVEYESLISNDTMMERDFERIQKKYTTDIPTSHLYSAELSQASKEYMQRHQLNETTKFLDIERIQRLPKLL
jgi:hypothetical protein